ncbi:hypothetical protein DB346_03065 [Verrucomicrobia bacterium LW23]|nr:hypothetical protein DB346_03590 [Verrucomicrobia bacterium LW23]PTY04430.1 hypothetical protein DB346_03065 [Verrucomicrobia bacterium LW23]
MNDSKPAPSLTPSALQKRARRKLVAGELKQARKAVDRLKEELVEAQRVARYLLKRVGRE